MSSGEIITKKSNMIKTFLSETGLKLDFFIVQILRPIRKTLCVILL